MKIDGKQFLESHYRIDRDRKCPMKYGPVYVLDSEKIARELKSGELFLSDETCVNAHSVFNIFHSYLYPISLDVCINKSVRNETVISV